MDANRGEEKKQRKTRSDKKFPVLPSLDADTHRKLKRLALACDISKTALAEEIIRLAVNHTEIIKHFQNKYNADEFRVIPIVNYDGSIDY